MKAKFAAGFAVIVLSGALLAGPALSGSGDTAMTAGEVLGKMNTDARSGFFFGAVWMAAHYYDHHGNTKKGECILKWFFRSGRGPREAERFFEANKEREAVPLLAVLIDRRCGK